MSTELYLHTAVVTDRKLKRKGKLHYAEAKLPGSQTIDLSGEGILAYVVSVAQTDPSPQCCASDKEWPGWNPLTFFVGVGAI